MIIDGNIYCENILIGNSLKEIFIKKQNKNIEKNILKKIKNFRKIWMKNCWVQIFKIRKNFGK